MICNSCNYKASCQHVGSEIYLSWRDECYIQHVNECLYEWNNIQFKYLGSLSRILGLNRENIDIIVRSSILLHDAGKLTRLYQRKVKEEVRLEGFKHEVLGSTYVFKLLKELKLNREIPYIASWAVLLHHEAMRKNLKPEQLVIPMNNPEVTIDIKAQLLLKSLLERNINVSVDSNIFSIDEVGEIVEWLFEYIFPRWYSSRHVLRLKVASLQHIICLSDVRAANRIRKGDVSSVYFREVMGAITD